MAPSSPHQTTLTLLSMMERCGQVPPPSVDLTRTPLTEVRGSLVGIKLSVKSPAWQATWQQLCRYGQRCSAGATQSLPGTVVWHRLRHSVTYGCTDPTWVAVSHAVLQSVPEPKRVSQKKGQKPAFYNCQSSWWSSQHQVTRNE